jgi:hypothetical protein
LQNIRKKIVVNSRPEDMPPHFTRCRKRGD